MPDLPDPVRKSELKRRIVVFGVIVAAGIVVACAYVAHAARRAREKSEAIVAPPVTTVEAVRARPHVMFLATDGDAYRRIALAPLDDPSQRVVTDIQCQRFHYQHGAGLALGGPNAPGGAWILDENLKLVRALSLQGIPSRARVSSDGRRAGMTFFVTGDSYLSGGFSTRSYVLDLTDRRAAPKEVEEMTLWRDDNRIEALDINYWGITFPRDAETFYATVATNDRRYLVQASLVSNEARVQHDDVECPSLSPDKKRIAFKKRVGGGSAIEWRLALLELESGVVRRLESEDRNVDDQVEWLDDGHVLYALRDAGPPSTLRPDVWNLAIDGSSPPTLFLKGAMSPVVVRP